MNKFDFTPQRYDRAAGASHREGFEFPPSVQADLFNYLKKEQQEYLRPYLRVLKKPAQVELCVALLDYMETGIHELPQTPVCRVIYIAVTRYQIEEHDDWQNSRIIRPLRNLHTIN